MSLPMVGIRTRGQKQDPCPKDALGQQMGTDAISFADEGGVLDEVMERGEERERRGRGEPGEGMVGDQQAETKGSQGIETGDLWDPHEATSISPPFTPGTNTSEPRARLPVAPYFKHHSSSPCPSRATEQRGNSPRAPV